jgi:hypothetical protein
MYNNQIINSTNKMKTTWNIIKSETGRPNAHTTTEYQNCPDAFNKYFLSIAETITHDIRCSNTKGYSNNKKIQNITCQNYLIILFPI